MGSTPPSGMGTVWHKSGTGSTEPPNWYVDKRFPYNVSRNRNGSSNQVICDTHPEAQIMHFEKMEVEYLLRGKKKKAAKCAEKVAWYREHYAEDLI